MRVTDWGFSPNVKISIIFSRTVKQIHGIWTWGILRNNILIITSIRNIGIQVVNNAKLKFGTTVTFNDYVYWLQNFCIWKTVMTRWECFEFQILPKYD